MNYLTENEVDAIMDYTGMEMAIKIGLTRTPVVYFSRDDGVLNFVTIISDFLKGSENAV